MTSAMQQKLVSTNAAIWTLAILASVIGPFITDSLTEGRSGFLRIVAHTAPLICGMFVSSLSFSNATGKPTT